MKKEGRKKKWKNQFRSSEIFISIVFFTSDNLPVVILDDLSDGVYRPHVVVWLGWIDEVQGLGWCGVPVRSSEVDPNLEQIFRTSMMNATLQILTPYS